MLDDLLQLPAILTRLAGLRLNHPQELLSGLRHMQSAGISATMFLHGSASRFPHQVAIIDDRTSVTYEQLSHQVHSLAVALGSQFNIGSDNTVGLLCRNHVEAVRALMAVASRGCELVLLNTDFPGDQLAQVIKRHKINLLIADEEFSKTIDAAGFKGRVLTAWRDTPGASLNNYIYESDQTLTPAEQRTKITMLTSGTTGVPKGAPRSPNPISVVPAILTLFSRIPFETGQVMLLNPPLFHGFGLGYLLLSIFLGSTIVLHRRFDAHTTLNDITRYGAESFAGVPVMYKRLLDLSAAKLRSANLSSMKIMITGGAPLSVELATRVMQTFGPVLYNLYGSTETGFTCMATPADLQAAPGTVGRPVSGTTIKLLNAEGQLVPSGEKGRIFIGSHMLFDGYSGGGNKAIVYGLMSTGDMGRFDDAGRLFIEGREDDMIVSGGENVFPQEVVEALLSHKSVSDAAAVGVADSEFGQRLLAFVVGTENNTEELLAFLKTKIARFKIPRSIISVKEIPRNPSGKVLRRALVEMAEAV